jgi:hypothetical protein
LAIEILNEVAEGGVYIAMRATPLQPHRAIYTSFGVRKALEMWNSCTPYITCSNMEYNIVELFKPETSKGF